MVVKITNFNPAQITHKERMARALPTNCFQIMLNLPRITETVSRRLQSHLTLIANTIAIGVVPTPICFKTCVKLFALWAFQLILKLFLTAQHLSGFVTYNSLLALPYSTLVTSLLCKRLVRLSWPHFSTYTTKIFYNVFYRLTI